MKIDPLSKSNLPPSCTDRDCEGEPDWEYREICEIDRGEEKMEQERAED